MLAFIPSLLTFVLATTALGAPSEDETLTVLTFAPAESAVDVDLKEVSESARERLRRARIEGIVVRPTGEGKLEVVWPSADEPDEDRSRRDRVASILEHHHALRFMIASDTRPRELDVTAERSNLEARLAAEGAGLDVRPLAVRTADGVTHRWFPRDDVEPGELAWLLCEDDADAVFTNSDFERTYVTVDHGGRPAIGFELRAARAPAFGAFTERHVNRTLAVVLDGRVHVAPHLSDRIERTGVLHGGANGYTSDEVKELRAALAAAPLPCALVLEGIRTE